MTYRLYLDAGNDPLFLTKDVGRIDGRLKHQCSCGGWEFAQLLLDVRLFDIGDDFACGGCISSWERNLVPIMRGDDFLIRHEWRASFIERRLGAKDPGAEEVKKQYLDKEIERVLRAEAKLTDVPAGHSSKVKLQKLRTKLELRRT